MNRSTCWEVPDADYEECLVEIGSFLRRTGLYDDDEEVNPPKSTEELDSIMDSKSVLSAIFNRAVSVGRQHALRVLGRDIVDAFVTAGFLEPRETLLVPKVSCSKWHDLFIFADPPTYRGKDVVYTFTQTTETLDKLIWPQAAQHAVDLGSGSGALSLRLADKATRVTAIDINPRAVALTRANCIMNGKTNVDVRVGEMFAPIDGEKVDMIVGNLPFVLSPDQDYLYRDGDRPSEQLIEDAIKGADAVLAPGGTAQFLCEWPIRNDPPEALRVWTRDCECDVVAIAYTFFNPSDHSKGWLHHYEQEDRAEYVRSLTRWLDWFKGEEILKVGYGALTLRKTDRVDREFKYFEAAKYPSSKGGDQISRILASKNIDFSLKEMSDVCPYLVPHELYQRLDHNGQVYISRPAELVSKDSAGVTMSIEPEIFPLLMAIDGKTNFRDLLQITTKAPQSLRELVSRGFLQI